MLIFLRHSTLSVLLTLYLSCPEIPTYLLFFFSCLFFWGFLSPSSFSFLSFLSFHILFFPLFIIPFIISPLVSFFVFSPCVPFSFSSSKLYFRLFLFFSSCPHTPTHLAFLPLFSHLIVLSFASLNYLCHLIRGHCPSVSLTA